MEIKKTFNLAKFEKIGGQLVAYASDLGLPVGEFPTHVVILDCSVRLDYWRSAVNQSEGDITDVEYEDFSDSKKRLIILND